MSFQKILYICALVCAFLVAYSNAACYMTKPTLDLNLKIPKVCKENDGTVHHFGDAWTKDCFKCQCIKPGRISCCTSFVDPIGYDEKLCEKVFNEQSCSYIVRKKDNPAETCKVTSSIG
ncbi:beta-microseminoprotein [Xenopus tropicalis]|uniref:Beta-microseminoprotein n=1 Tax=Xenopus tropicalis TaxID=8364 RepID=A0A8J1JYW4_XENTR|nr:beta-microseminoprotein [Xenopus tropicalis]